MDSNPPLLYARDLMERALITVSPETRILDIHRLFTEEEVHGAPVVADDGRVVGVLSSLDLLRIVRDALEAGDVERLQELTAEDAMTRAIVMVSANMPLTEVAATMLEHRIHRVLIGDDRVLAGLITSFDLLRAVARGAEAPAGLLRQTGYVR